MIQQLQRIETSEGESEALHRPLSSLPLWPPELSVNTAQFAKSAAMLGNSEDHTALSRALSQLAEVEEKIDQLHQEQANADLYLFSELLGDYVRLIGAVKVWTRNQAGRNWFDRKTQIYTLNLALSFYIKHLNQKMFDVQLEPLFVVYNEWTPGIFPALGTTTEPKDLSPPLKMIKCML